MNTDKIYAESIAKDYAPKSASKVVALKKLNRQAKRPAMIFTYTFGVVFSLVLGAGMCLSMHVIGSASIGMTVLGVILGLIGIAGVSVNYPIYPGLHGHCSGVDEGKLFRFPGAYCRNHDCLHSTLHR